jgi:nicotinate-nucleotide pyrophosphorylase (carboxylating)
MKLNLKNQEQKIVKEKAKNELIKSINKWFEEDRVFDDITSNLIGLNKTKKRGIMVFFSKSKDDFVLAGADFIETIFKMQKKRNAYIKIKSYKKDGDIVRYGEKICEVYSDNIGLLLSRERICLNLLCRLSAIATATHKLTEKARKYGVRILATRKTTPGLRMLEKYAVSVGGGEPYRIDLSSSFMIKDNHIRALGGMRELVNFFEKLEPKIKRKILKKGITIEVQKEEELDSALKIAQILKKEIREKKGKEDVFNFTIMLDNFQPKTLRKLIRKIRNFSSSQKINISIELSGGIREHNIEKFLKLKPDAISSGYITLSPPYFPDISADIL